MLIAKDTSRAADFHQRVRAALRLAAVALPAIAWHADFDVGPGEHVEIFGAPDSVAARKVSEFVATSGVRAEVSPLREPW